MKITITSGNAFRYEEYVAMNEEGRRLAEEAAARANETAVQKSEKETAARLTKAQSAFQNLLDDAVDNIAKSNTSDPAGKAAGSRTAAADNTTSAAKKATDSSASGTTKSTSGTLDSYFEKASKKYGVEKQLLLAVAKLESDFDSKATSKAGAQGIMQLMPSTAKYLGVSDSYDPEQNIMGGAKYLAELLSRYNGDKSKALAAYNAGPNRVDSYGGVPPAIQSYVDTVMGYYNAKVQAPDANTVTKDASNTSNDLTKTSKELKFEMAKFPEHMSYDMFLEELQKELEKEETPQDENATYKMLLNDSRTAIERIKNRI